MQKRGQMYLVAALIIAALIIGLGSIYNYARVTGEDTRIADLSKEIDFETSKVIDWGTYKVEDRDAISQRVDEISSYYANLNPRSELITVFGNPDPARRDEITTTYYKLKNEGTICIQSGSGCSSLDIFKKQKAIPAPQFSIDANDIITVDLGSRRTYDFEMKQGENFFIVLINNIDNEKFVSAPELR